MNLRALFLLNLET
eukprot:CCRYP_013000-RE/>CCRYP_013000-RE protein AED:0.49 eAED:0.49 QI:0/0/0/1/0/0/2/0/13